MTAVLPSYTSMTSTRTPTSSRSESFASHISSASTSIDLSATACKVLNALCNERDFSSIPQYVSADVMVQHSDNPPIYSREALIAGWSRTLQRTPSFHMHIKEACVDESQRKVWVRSEISGLPGGIRKESIDMMSFDEEGMLIKTEDYQRVIRVRDDDD